MSVAFKAKFHAANDGPQTVPGMRLPKSGPRVVPLITLRSPKKKSVHWAVPCALAVLVTGIGAAAFWYADNVLELLKPPVLSPIAMPDPEQASAYAETITPPLADVVAPTPELPVLPEALVLAAVAETAKDPTAGIALPASSLQTPLPAVSETTKADPAIAVIADKIKDLPVMQDDPAQITVREAGIPAADSLLDKAQAKLDADDGEGALAIYDHISAREPANRAALEGKADALKSAGQYEAAAAAYHRLLALNPKDETVRSDLVSTLGAWGSPAASNELQRIVAKRPGFAPAQAALAKVLVGQGNALDALPHAWRASQIEPDNILYRLNLAITYDRLGHSSEAIGFYRQVLNAYDSADTRTADLPISQPEIRQRVSYLQGLMQSAEKLASEP